MNNNNLLKSDKTYYIKQQEYDKSFSVISIETIKNFLKINLDDTTHDDNLNFFKRTAVDYSQKFLKTIILPTKYKMIIGDYTKSKTNNIELFYHQFYRGGAFSGNIEFFANSNINANGIKDLKIPLSPLIKVDNITVDDRVLNINEFSFNNLQGSLSCGVLNNSFSNAQIDFTVGIKSDSEIASDVFNAILNHIYFMWMENDFSIDVPNAVIQVYKFYERSSKFYRV